MSVPLSEDGYPKPLPPGTKKADIYKPKDYAHVNQKAATAPADLVEDYDKLIQYLTDGLGSDLAKVRSIFIWLAAQRVVTSTFPKHVNERSPQAFLKKIKFDRILFSDFFALLCRKAGVPCVIIEGSSKGAGYEVGQRVLNVANRWNAVYVQGAWRLVNVPWALVRTDGLEEGERWLLVEQEGLPCREWEQATKEVLEDTDEFWFLTDPRDFNCFLHPKDPRWQLMDKPWTEDEYHDMPKFEKDYFQSQWELISAYSSVLRAEGGRVQIRFAHPVDIALACLQYKLFFCPALSKANLPDDLQLDRYVLEDSSIGQKALLTRLPVEGVYRIQVAGQLDDSLSVLAEFRIDSVEVKGQPAPFPSIISSTPVGPTEEAKTVVEHFSHEEGVVTAKQGERVEMKFGFKTRNVRFQPTFHHNNMNPDELKKYIQCNTNKNDVNVSLTIPKTDGKDGGNQDEYAFTADVIATTVDENGQEIEMEYKQLINYLVTADVKLTFPTQKESIKAKANLLSSLKKFNIDKLNESMTHAEKAGVLDPITRDKVTSWLVVLNKMRGEKLKELHQAMKAGDVGQLEAALAEYTDMGSVDPATSQSTRAVLELLRALKDDDDVTRLEKALRDVLSLKVDVTGHVQRASNRLMDHYEKGLSEAYNKRSLDEVTEYMQSMEKSCVANRLLQEPMYQKAKKLCHHLKEVKRVTQAVGQLATGDLKVFSDSRGRSPHPHVHSVMMAIFILLGEKEGDLWEWSAIQNLVERRKAESGVVRLMAQLNVDDLTEKKVDLAETHVKECRLDVVRTECGVAPALFLEWVLLMVEEWRGRQAVRHNTSEIFNPGN